MRCWQPEFHHYNCHHTALTNAKWRRQEFGEEPDPHDYGVRLGKEPSRYNPKSHTTTMPTFHKVAWTHIQIN